MNKFFQVLSILVFMSLQVYASGSIKVEAPEFVILQDSVEININNTEIAEDNEWPLRVANDNNVYSFLLIGSQNTIKLPISSTSNFIFRSPGFEKRIQIRKVPGWFSIIPPLVAIALALIFKEVILSLFAGIFIGAIGVFGFSFSGIVQAFLSFVDKYILTALSDSGNLSVIIFSVAIGGMVSIISRNGGMQGIVDKLSKFAHTAKSAQLVTWALGIAIFFDDYANTLIVGNTMRPVTDKFKVSREKLAYIVDSTAAPIAALAFITTWIGAELGYISKASENLGIEEGAYSMFLNSLQYAYYPLLTLVFMFILLYMGKDFGPMYKAEKRARESGEIQSAAGSKNFDDEHFKPVNADKCRWYNGFIPVMTVILVTICGLVITGIDGLQGSMISSSILKAETSMAEVWNSISLFEGEDMGFFRKLGVVIGASDAYVALLWASFCGIALAVILSVSQKIMSVVDTMSVLIEGFKTMVPAMLILILAWSLTEITHELKTADFITGIFKGNVNPVFLPSITFLLAAFIAFSTGSSWGTMAILYPLALPASWILCQETGMDQGASMEIFYHVIAVVLAGSVLGDHCSPISDTTIMSSLASQCYHVDHVKTQLPYALTVGGISLILSLIANILPFHWTILYILGIAFVWLAIRVFGKKIIPRSQEI